MKQDLRGFSLVLLLMALAWSPVRAQADHEAHDDHEAHGAHQEEERRVHLDAAALAEFGVVVRAAAGGDLDIGVSLPGEVTVNQDRLAHVTPRASGVVEEVLVHVGDRVASGQVLAILASAELGERQIEYLALKQQAEIARTDLEREDSIHENTSRVLTLLQEGPDLDALHLAMEGRDLGTNRTQLVSTYSQMLLARTTYERERALAAKNISSQAEFLQAESTHKQAKATYLATVDDITFDLKRSHIERHRTHAVAQEALLAAARRLELMGVSQRDLDEIRGAEAAAVKIGRVEIRAPLGGIVIEKHVVLGELLQVDTQAFTVVDLQDVWVDLRVYQRDLAQVRTGLRVGISAGHGIPDVDGVLSYLAPTVQEDTRTILARVVLTNPQGLWRPGLFVKGHIRAEETHGAVVVPATALQTLEGEVSVFVKTDRGFEAREVRIGRRGTQAVEILDGLAPGEVYVAEGSFNLKAELGKGALRDGHHH